MTADDVTRIKWWFRWLKEYSHEMTENELKWASRFEDKFLKIGELSPREMEILEEIYNRRTGGGEPNE